MRRALLILGLAALPALAKEKAPPQIAMTAQHVNPTGAFSFWTPDGWKEGPVVENPEGVEVSKDQLMVRFLYSPGDSGYDSLHSTCMLIRLADAMDQAPQVTYEYDFLSAEIDEMRLLDSAFDVKYDNPVMGASQWRQRNLTIVGRGHSLCAISYAPTAIWKKSVEARTTLDSIVKSVVFK